MNTLIHHILVNRMFSSLEDEKIELKEGVGQFVQDHPFLTSMAAGYLLSKSLKSARGTATINPSTQLMKFFARSAVERKIQKQLVATLIQSTHYKLVSSKQEGDAYVWTLKRQQH